jgi:hypothetical protein
VVVTLGAIASLLSVSSDADEQLQNRLFFNHDEERNCAAHGGSGTPSCRPSDASADF